MKHPSTTPRILPWPVWLLLPAALGVQACDVPGFEKLDRDGDGVVSSEEASDWHGLSELFDTYDDNGDGQLDQREYQALVEDAAREADRVITTSE